MPASELVHVPTKESSLRAPTPILDQQHHHTPAKTQALTRPLSEQSPLELSPADPTRGQRLKTDSKKRYTYFVSDAVGRRPPTRMAWHGPPHAKHTERCDPISRHLHGMRVQVLVQQRDLRALDLLDLLPVLGQGKAARALHATTGPDRSSAGAGPSQAWSGARRGSVCWVHWAGRAPCKRQSMGTRCHGTP